MFKYLFIKLLFGGWVEMTRKVLFVSPHTDDIEFGCGGTIRRFVEDKVEVYCIILSDCMNAIPKGFEENSLNKECFSSLTSLGVKKDRIFIFQIENKEFQKNNRKIYSILEDLKNKIKPDLVVIPSLNDPHQDHKTVAEESLRVFRHNISIICYEEPWNHSKFEPKFFVRLTKGHLNHKINALKKYKTQRKLKRFYFDYKFIEGLARVRGSHIFSEYAEGFEVIKLIQ